MNDTAWMRIALDEAARAEAHGDVPVGAIAVLDGIIIGRGHNCRELDRDPTAHAEMLALREAARAVHHWRLDGVTLYCTLEPCAMCAGAMVLARLPRLVYATPDPKAGAGGSVMDLLNHPHLNHKIQVESGVLRDDAAALLVGFFAKLRAAGERGRPRPITRASGDG
jgi:tRNA(adenine34) deaminase